MHQKLCMVFELALETHKVAKTRRASAYARRTFRNGSTLTEATKYIHDNRWFLLVFGV